TTTLQLSSLLLLNKKPIYPMLLLSLTSPNSLETLIPQQSLQWIKTQAQEILPLFHPNLQQSSPVTTRPQSTPHHPGTPHPIPMLLPGFTASCPAFPSAHLPRPNDPDLWKSQKRLETGKTKKSPNNSNQVTHSNPSSHTITPVSPVSNNSDVIPMEVDTVYSPRTSKPRDPLTAAE
ncbi:hypothetical protein C0992_005157, partial [Termitomyces sp. T32_za158]